MLWDEARAAKEQLSRAAMAGLHVPVFDVETHLTRAEFEHLARPPVDRTVALTADTLARSGITPQRVAGLFLVGGSSRIPMVANLLHQRLGIAPTVIEQPELVVAQGALLTVTAAATGVPPAGPVPPPQAPPAPVVVAAPHLPDDLRAPRVPSPRRRRRIGWLAAGTAVAVLAATIYLVIRWNDDAPGLTTRSERNAAVFTTPALRDFARPWLNDVASCEQRPADSYGGHAREYVACAGEGWEVQFRALDDIGERNKSRYQRTLYGQSAARAYTGASPRAGQRIDYLYRTDRVIYWDDDGSAMVGDLTTAELDRARLSEIWDSHVQATR
jgi:hypothetical protein